MKDPMPSAYYVLGKSLSMIQWSWASHHNNNVMLIGAPGSGKTRYNIIPNINRGYGSYIIVDPKGSLYKKCAGVLEEQGYEVKRFDLEEMESDCAYDPYASAETEADLRSVSHELVYVYGPSRYDDFWNQASENVLHALALKSRENSEDHHAHFAQIMDLLEYAYEKEDGGESSSPRRPYAGITKSPAYMAETYSLGSRLDTLMLSEAVGIDSPEGRKLCEAADHIGRLVSEFRVAEEKLAEVPYCDGSKDTSWLYPPVVMDEKGFFAPFLHMYDKKSDAPSESDARAEYRGVHFPEDGPVYVDLSEVRRYVYDVSGDLDPADSSRLKKIDGFKPHFSDAERAKVERLEAMRQRTSSPRQEVDAITAAEHAIAAGRKQKLPDLATYLFRSREDVCLFRAVQECYDQLQEATADLAREIRAYKATREETPSFKAWRRARAAADKTWLSTMATLNGHTDAYRVPQMARMLGESALPRLDFASAGAHECAYFIVVSDSDRSRDPFVRIMLRQAVNALERAANREKNNALTVPVRFIVDDFPTIGFIDGIQSWLNTTRSREISWTLAAQGVGQLEYVYGHAGAQALMAACDTQIYVGAPNDDSTAQMLGKRIEGDPYLQPLDKQWVFIRGEKPLHVEFCDPDARPDEKDLKP